MTSARGDCTKGSYEIFDPGSASSSTSALSEGESEQMVDDPSLPVIYEWDESGSRRRSFFDIEDFLALSDSPPPSDSSTMEDLPTCQVRLSRHQNVIWAQIYLWVVGMITYTY